MKMLRVFLFGLLSLNFSLTAVAGEGEAQLERFFSGLTTLEAEFRQSIYNARLEPVQSAEGMFQMKRPGKFRWDYTRPYEQLIVADGKKLWIHDVDLEQVTVKSMDNALGNTPALLLSNPERVSQTFRLIESGKEEGVSWLALEPRQEAERTFEHLRLGFQDNQLRLMELVDSFGQMTRLEFSAIRRNVALPADHFRFVVPDGVDVVGEE